MSVLVDGLEGKVKSSLEKKIDSIKITFSEPVTKAGVTVLKVENNVYEKYNPISKSIRDELKDYELKLTNEFHSSSIKAMSNVMLADDTIETIHTKMENFGIHKDTQNVYYDKVKNEVSCGYVAEIVTQTHRKNMEKQMDELLSGGDD